MRFNFFFFCLYLWTSLYVLKWVQKDTGHRISWFFFSGFVDCCLKPIKRFCFEETFLTRESTIQKSRQKNFKKSAQKFKFPQKTRNLVYKIVTAVATPCFFFIFYFFFWIYVIYTCMYMDIYLLKLVTLFLLCKHFVIKNHFTLHGKKVSNAQFTCFL